MSVDDLKRQAAYYAVDHFVRDGMRLGLGHGSTIAHALDRLAEHRRRGQLPGILAVPVSDHTARACQRLDIPLTTLEAVPQLDLCIDGADEVDPHLNLIKGLGGALLREKIVAVASQRMVVIVDQGKLVPVLGIRAPLPVEVLPFGWTTHLPWLEALGCRPQARLGNDGQPAVTDNGNHLYDCRFPEGIHDPSRLEAQLNNRPGVVENGLFLGLADRVVVATPEGVAVKER